MKMELKKGQAPKENLQNITRLFYAPLPYMTSISIPSLQLNIEQTARHC